MKEEKIFSIKELSKYNGKKGRPSYVAVDGVVYDVTDVFDSGDHYAHLAGNDLTDDFYLQHAKSEIEKYPIVGKLDQRRLVD